MDVNLIQKFTIIFRCNTSEDRRSCTDGGNIEGNNVVVRYEEVQNALEQEDNHEQEQEPKQEHEQEQTQQQEQEQDQEQ